MSEQRLPSDLPAELRASHFNAVSPVLRWEYIELPRDVAKEAQELLDNGFPAKARALIQRSPGWERTIKARVILGNILKAEERFEEAEAEWERADAINDEVHARFRSTLRANKGDSRLEKGEYESAVQLCDEAIAAYSAWAVPWVIKLGALNQSGKQDEIPDVFRMLDRVWPAWRTDEFFAKRLETDAHLTGAKKLVPAP